MLKQKPSPFHLLPGRLWFLTVLLGLMLSAAPLMQAQTPDNYDTQRQRGIELINQSKFAEALPIFEKLAATNPSDGQVQYGLGIAIMMSTDGIKEAEAQRKARMRARTALLQARELGVRDENLDILIKSVLPDGNLAGVSGNVEANAAMGEASTAFAKQEYEKAAREYERAARLDPTLYEAALYTGNSHYALKNWDKAGEWFARAIAIDAGRETAYRYWGDALMHSGKQEAARDKFFDAIIAEPYSQMVWRGLLQWAQRNQIKLGHPKIDIPAKVSTAANGNVSVTVDERALSGKDDGSAAWMMYGLARAAWMNDKTGKLSEKFARAYPGEKAYRHSLAEEMDALRLVITSLKEQKNVKQLEPSLATLVKLQEAGLLEPYILFARADQGIARDYDGYQKASRDKLRRYLLEWVLTGGGK